MATSSSNITTAEPYLFKQPKSLENICRDKIRGNQSFDLLIFHFTPYWSLGLDLTFKYYIRRIRDILAREFYHDSFGIWFVEMVNCNLSALERSRDLKQMVKIIKQPIRAIEKFRAVYGPVEDVLDNLYLVQYHIERLRV